VYQIFCLLHTHSFLTAKDGCQHLAMTICYIHIFMADKVRCPRPPSLPLCSCSGLLLLRAPRCSHAPPLFLLLLLSCSQHTLFLPITIER